MLLKQFELLSTELRQQSRKCFGFPLGLEFLKFSPDFQADTRLRRVLVFKGFDSLLRLVCATKDESLKRLN